MSRFFVGQRVRIKFSHVWPELMGKEGVIVGRPNPSAWGLHGRIGDWRVTPDGCTSPLLPSAASPTGNAYFCPLEDQLEPLTDSNELVSWESMRDLWVPEHWRVQA